MANQQHWKHIWPSANILADFIFCNQELVKNRRILEIGSGATGVCGLTAAKIGAAHVWLSDHPEQQVALETLKENVENNGVGGNCEILGLDWDNPKSIENFLTTTQNLDLTIASDVFFDPSTFQGLTRTFSQILERFPQSQIWFAYQERDDNWTTAELFEKSGLHSSLIRKTQADAHTIQLISVVLKRARMKWYGGIEGGGTASKLVFIDETGEKRIWSESIGTNYYLQGVEKVGDHVAEWIRRIAAENRVLLPLESLGMGLSGAEDASINETFCQYLRDNHGDIARNVHLESDAVCTVAANFDEQGIVLIAGTGSSCRMLMKNGEVKGVGGWGHSIGDGGSAYWIANRAIRTLFDDDDGLEKAKFGVEKIRELLCDHFKIADKIGILDFLYHKFEKHTIAQFTKTLSENPEDPQIAEIFKDAGIIIAKHVAAISKHLDSEDRKELSIVLVGSVFKSWNLLKSGFVEELKRASDGIRRVRLYLPSENPAVGAAVFAAHLLCATRIEHAKNKQICDVIEIV
ncbi:unnamed protein product [Caenorhabditis angaria]|uniref:N-acetyl-D-glucosamine kinase n=1 Tax=Caenorhabditis angaria TaxID=860376 RepID=A0A9P1IEW4_9PELO|nr:unnamed protein product [Caenorhabditis angaria]